MLLWKALWLRLRRYWVVSSRDERDTSNDWLTADEVRALENRRPLTDAQIASIERKIGRKLTWQDGVLFVSGPPLTAAEVQEMKQLLLGQAA